MITPFSNHWHKSATDVDIVVVNWNAGDLLRECVDSVILHAIDRSRLIVVDNHSTDDSIGSIDRAEGKGYIQVVRLAENLGFARACNIGACQGSSEFVLFLNPDAKIYPETIASVLTFMRSKNGQAYGICGVRLEGEGGLIQRHCARFPMLSTFVGKTLGLSRLFPRWFPPHFLIEFDHLASREVDQVIGAFFFVRRSLFEELGGFDERFFVYFEELDFSLRARRAGWRTWYLAEAHAYHKGGGTSEQVKALRLFYSLRSRLLYGFKHFDLVQAWGLTAVTCIVEPMARLVQAAARLSLSNISEVLRGTAMLWRDLPTVLGVALADRRRPQARSSRQ